LDHAGTTLTLGEVQSLEPDSLRLLAPPFAVAEAWTAVVRDARRDRDGRLVTAPRWEEPPVPEPVPDQSIDLPGPTASHATNLRTTLVGGLFGDPLLHIRPGGEARSLFLDLGEHPQLPVRLAHRVSDIFLTHAHMDHFAGFPWLLRRRVGVREPCRVYGPPGTMERVVSLLSGFTWDRIGDDGPRFEIAELHGDRLLRWWAQAGEQLGVPRGEEQVRDGVIHAEAGFEVHASVLDHGTPVLAFAVQESRQLKIRRDRLDALNLPPGRWLSELKDHLLAGQSTALVSLPDGGQVAAGELAKDLVVERPGQKLAYATDVSDTAANREALTELARGAQILVCEASFLERHADRARATGHLTARACGEIAAAAGVRRLLPFHLSNRYQDHPQEVIREVMEVFDRVWLPRSLAHYLARR
jgi:ribonuclease BN (tRNA processing enzyme)